MHLTTSDQPALELGFRNYSCNWGTHICMLYESEAEREQVVYNFLHTGDVRGDLQLYAPSVNTPREFSQRYANIFPECACHTEDEDRFRLMLPHELYYPQGSFSPWDMDRGLNGFYADSQIGGQRNIRATAEMSWALAAVPGVEDLMAYEARLNYFIPGKPWVSICLYDVNRFSGKILMNVLRTHPFAISGGVITHNPYYQTPDEWLSANAPQYLGAPGG